ncbi:MAG: mercuric transport protein MerTP [Bacteroidetes bacterium]|nr:MAG: mercuric transport protein MerTP [Bacteroidota bacterium]
MKTADNTLNSSSNSKWIGAGLLAAITASLCCITPVLALLSGVSGVAATFSWMEPVRPFLIALTIGILGFAWYQKLKPRKTEEIDCACEEDVKPSFWQSKMFLGMVTIFAAVMLVFPSYSGIFFPENNVSKTIIVKENDIVEGSLTIKGMTCTGCEHSVNFALTSSEGVIEASSSYETGIASVKFDKSKISIDELATAVEKETGYKVIDKEINNN